MEVLRHHTGILDNSTVSGSQLTQHRVWVGSTTKFTNRSHTFYSSSALRPESPSVSLTDGRRPMNYQAPQ